MSYLSVPLSVFLIFVAPLWLILHYRNRKYINKTFSHKDQEQLQAVQNRTEQLQNRITSLEKILDSEAPDWRNK